jgi:integrase
MVDGKRKRVSLGTRSKAEAIVLRDKLNNEINQYGDILPEEPEKEVNDKFFTFGDAIDFWWEQAQLGKKTNSLRNMEAQKEKLRKAFGTYLLEDIEFEDVEKWYNDLGKYKGGYKNQLTAKAYRVFSYAVKKKKLKIENPFDTKGVLREGVENTPSADRIKRFTRPELELLMDKATGELKNIIILRASTGLRINETFAIKNPNTKNPNTKNLNTKNPNVIGNEIDFEKGLLKIEHGMNRGFHSDKVIESPKTKNSKREVPLNEDVLAVIESQVKIAGDRDYLFVEGNPNTFIKKWNKLLDECGLERRVFYCLRHTFASILLSEGEPVAKVSRWMGHTNVVITQSVYFDYITKEGENNIPSVFRR